MLALGGEQCRRSRMRCSASAAVPARVSPVGSSAKAIGACSSSMRERYNRLQARSGGLLGSDAGNGAEPIVGCEALGAAASCATSVCSSTPAMRKPRPSFRNKASLWTQLAERRLFQ
jgi:hypothetical protein